MWPATGWCSMPPSEDAQLLLRIVERHLRSLNFGLDEQFPAEDWGFTAQQAVEKLLKCWIVLADGEPPRSHELDLLASQANLELADLLLDLQPLRWKLAIRTATSNCPQVGAEFLRRFSCWRTTFAKPSMKKPTSTHDEFSRPASAPTYAMAH